jgi:hypothetical protein
MAKLTLADITATYAATTQMNQNNTDIEAAIENTLSRDGTAPNTMSAELDMNSNKVINVADGVADADGANLGQVTNLITEQSGDFGGTANASQINITDAGGYYDSSTVETALQEVFSDLEANTTGEGASRIGIEDSGTLITATDVEGALAELATGQATATITTEGIVELATAAELDAGTADKIPDGAAFDASDNYSNDSGTFMITWDTGFTSSPTSTFEYVRFGKFVTVTVQNSFASTSNSVDWSASVASWPSDLRPATQSQRPMCAVTDNGVDDWGTMSLSTTGFVQLNYGADFAGWTASGDKGFPQIITMTYSLY